VSKKENKVKYTIQQMVCVKIILYRGLKH